ncbi:vesicle transport protein SEC20-like [Phlebotomus argentipes]|uniref:vesicle transport protein SEC20-like n=1 Tax=Phlebotomus argentipes TaxID=94469 RepID=UPI002893654E|nr:vesicle transport protein SEC20-like [Phlebotomus argentipes]XP_059620723.1 vesicle transport protein SEC20-like [Phlebotomus argentipes]
MDTQKYTLSSLKQDIVDNNLHVKAIIQDILAFRGSLVDLENLNEAGRAKISALRKCIERLDDWARDEGDPEVAKDVDSHRQQLTRTLQAFRKANVSTMLEIEKADKQELLTPSGENELRQRQTRLNRSSLVSQQESVTDKMLSISRHLSETTQKSAATLDTLIASSSTVEGTRDELVNTGGTITQSGKLLNKYGRRECTDKIVLLFAFIFFLACVFYIVQKRLF